MKRLILAAAAIALASPAYAGGSAFSLPSYMQVQNPMVEGPTWEVLRGDVVEDEVAILEGDDLLSFDAPVEAFDAATVPFTIRQREGTGERITKMTIVVDENPMPIVGEFEFGPLMGDIDLESRVRFDVYSNIRVVAETETGGTYMTGRFVQAAGGCTAAVTRDLDVALATMGKMKLRPIDTSGGKPLASGAVRQAQLMIRHPMFTGMQMHMGTLNPIDPRFINELEVRLGDDMLFRMWGGFSISEDPSFRFSYIDNGAEYLTVRAVDTDGAVFEKRFPIGPGA
ncbi:MAG: quinoprotein dehydrogenase-associated SoxYZ-like carrier [Pseudomonadota bacterium]